MSSPMIFNLTVFLEKTMTKSFVQTIQKKHLNADSSMNQDKSKFISPDLIDSYHRSESKPEGWTEVDAINALNRYEKFFLLAAKHPRAPLAPTKDIDVMWHLHMLSPKAYYEDCMRTMGEIFDHDGGYGKGEGELPKLQATFSNTEQLWLSEYGEPYRTQNELGPDGLVNCWHDCQNRCWHACSNKIMQEVA